MAHVGRSVKNIETPRPLKSQSKKKNNYMVIEEVIQLIENVASRVTTGVVSPETMNLLVDNLQAHGPQLESISKDTLDRAFVSYRNASQDERLNIMTRLNLLQIIELRAKGWEDNGINSYYKSKATNVEPESVATNQTQMTVEQSTNFSTSPNFASSASLMQGQQGAHLLAPGELIRNSGKFIKPTKIPGKNYCKDEVVIRNADSGKVMGIKGRRVHMIEELSETIISFQKVNPGAKERLVQITGPSEEKINLAKNLIEDTIVRNASPVCLEQSIELTVHGNAGGVAGGSCSSLASSASDEVQQRGVLMSSGSNRIAGSSNPNFVSNAVQTSSMGGFCSSTPLQSRSNQLLLHSFSTNDASLGEYKYTVNVGQHLMKITGDCCELVKVAKLVLDDYFSTNDFFGSFEDGTAIDQPIRPTPTKSINTTSFADSGVSLNYMGGQFGNNAIDGDDDVFVEANSSGVTSGSGGLNGLTRSRRSHFSRKDSAPEGDKAKKLGEEGTKNKERIVHEYEHLLFYSKSPHSWALPRDWEKMVDKYPTIIRNKVTSQSSSTSSTSSTHPRNTQTNKIAQNDNNCDDKLSTLPPNVVRKGFFNRHTYSIDEGSTNAHEFNNNNVINNLNKNATSTYTKDSATYNKANNNPKGNDQESILVGKKTTTNRPPKLTMDARSNSTCN